MSHSDSINAPAVQPDTLSRRRLLGKLGRAAAGVLAGTAVGAAALAQPAAPVVNLSPEGPELLHAPQDEHYRAGHQWATYCREKAGIKGVAQPADVGKFFDALAKERPAPSDSLDSESLWKELAGENAEACEARFLALFMTRLSGKYSQVETERLSFVAGFANAWYGLD